LLTEIKSVTFLELLTTLGIFGFQKRAPESVEILFST